MINAEIKSYCERLVRLEQERKALAADIADIKKEAAGKGYDKALINKTVSLMLKDADKRQKALEQHELFDSYLIAAGLLAETETAPNVGGPTGEATETPLKQSASPVQSIQDTQPVHAHVPVAIQREALAEVLHAPVATSAPIQADLASSLGQPVATAVDDEPAMQGGGAPVASPDSFDDIPAHLDRRVKPKYTPEQLLGAG